MPAQQLPREILDEIVSYVRDFEDDEDCVTTLYSLTLTCHSYFHAAIPALYHDPSRAHGRWLLDPAGESLTRLQTLLTNRPHLASHVHRLSRLATKYAWEEYSETVGEEIYRIIIACHNVEELEMPVRLQGSVLLAAITAGTLRHLRHLVLNATIHAHKIDDLSIAQDFIRIFGPSRKKLDSLSLKQFGAGGDGPSYPDCRPSFALGVLEFEQSWGSWWFISSFVPSDKTTLEEVEIFLNDNDDDIEPQDIEEFQQLVAPFIRRFSFCRTWISGSMTSIDEYERSTNHKQWFDFTHLFAKPFPNLHELVMEGLAGLSVVAFTRLSTSCPSLRLVSFANSSWIIDEWTDPETNCLAIRHAISSLSFIRRLHLGNLPLIQSETAFHTIQSACDDSGIDFAWQPCLVRTPRNSLVRLDVQETTSLASSSTSFTLQQDLPQLRPVGSIDSKDHDDSDSIDTTISSTSSNDGLLDTHSLDTIDTSIFLPSPRDTSSSSPCFSDDESFFPGLPGSPRFEEGYEAVEEEDDIEKEDAWEEWIEKVDIVAADERWKEGEGLETGFDGRGDRDD